MVNTLKNNNLFVNTFHLILVLALIVVLVIVSLVLV